MSDDNEVDPDPENIWGESTLQVLVAADRVPKRVRDVHPTGDVL
ncbi:MAG: hypothetical protein ABWY45_15585 [Mycobacterium sp.]